MSHISTSPRPSLRIVPRQSEVLTECQEHVRESQIRDLGQVPGQICECGAELHLIIDQYGLYDFSCSKPLISYLKRRF
jgi:hypothetical protein